MTHWLFFPTEEAAPEDAGDILSATFWLRAEDADFTLDGSDGVSAAVNMGSAGSAMDLVQATGADRPIRVASVVNGKAVLRFVDTDELETADVAGGAFTSADENVVFLVMQADSETDQNTPFYYGVGLTEEEFGAHITWEDGIIYFDTGDNDAGGRISGNPDANWLTGFHIVELVRDGADAEILVDGVSLATDDAMTADAGGAGTVPFHLGSRTGAEHFYVGDLAEIIIARGATAVSSAIRAEAREALATYYNITLP